MGATGIRGDGTTAARKGTPSCPSSSGTSEALRVKKSLVQPSEAGFEDPHHLRLAGCASVIDGRHEGPGLLHFDHDDGFDPVDELRTLLAKPIDPFHEPVRPGG
jgi:hypothetical protein